MMFNASRLTSDGYQTYSGVKEDNYQFKLQKPLGKDTMLTAFSTYNKIHSHAPDKAGVALAQVARYGKDYSLNNDKTSQNYYGYNYNDKRTDFEYIRLQSKLDGGWAIDNTLYTYAYDNFKRSLDALVNQGTRIATKADQTYTTSLPFLTAHYAVNKQWSAYGQVARGFLVPELSMFYVNNPNLSTPKPQTSTNYQLGTVHQSGSLTFDADICYIDFNNKIASTGSGNDLVYCNQGGVVYKGVEGAATYYVGSVFALHANGSVNKAEAKDTGLQVAKAPKSTAALGLLYKDHGLYGSLIAKVYLQDTRDLSRILREIQAARQPCKAVQGHGRRRQDHQDRASRKRTAVARKHG